MSTKTKIIVYPLISTLMLSATAWFFSHYQVKAQSPISIKLATPIYWVRRAMAMNITIVKEADPIPLNENEKYLCIKFGDQCRTALQIQHLENGSEQCDRMHVNDNHTVDFGFMQINTVHLSNSVKVSDLIDCKKNIDIAYELYKKQGWGIWSTYKLIK